MTANRKAHVKRVFKQSDDGSLDKTIWMDVLRFDQLYLLFKGLKDQQTGLGVIYKFLWNDDPNNANGDIGTGDIQQENAVAKRQTHKLTIKNPTDETQTNSLWLVDKLAISQRSALQPGDSTGGAHQLSNWKFNNVPLAGDDSGNPPSQTRKFTPIKVVNNDLGGLDMSQGPVDWDTYLDALKGGTIDDSQKLDVEVPDSFLINYPIPDAKDGIKGQMVKVALSNNQQIEGLFQASDPDAALPPVRTDPLQVIVNVSWVSLLIQIGFGWADIVYGADPPVGAVTGTVDDTTQPPPPDNVRCSLSFASLPTLQPSAVPVNIDVSVPSKQETVKWLNDGVHKDVFPGTAGIATPADYPGGVPPCYIDVACIHQLIGVTVNPGGATANQYNKSLILQYLGGAVGDTAKDIRITVSGAPGSVAQNIGGPSISCSVSFTDGTTDSGSITQISAFTSGTPGPAFGVIVYSGKDYKFDPASQKIVARDPSNTLLKPGPISITTGGGSVRVGDQIIGAITGDMTFRVEMKKVGDKDYPVVWPKTPTPAEPLDKYSWTIYDNTHTVIASGTQTFGTAPS